MLRLAYLTGTWGAPSETFIAAEIAALRAAPDVALVPAAIWRGPEPADDEVAFLTAAPRVAARPRAGAGSPLWDGVPAGWRRRWSLARHQAGVARLMALLRERQVTHVHAGFADLPGLLVATAAAQAGIGYSVSVHAGDVAQAKYPDNALFGQAQAVFACNAHAAQVLAARYPAVVGRLHVIHHGLRLADWPLRTSLAPPTPGVQLRLLCVGRLVRKKRVDRALALLAALLAAGCVADLTVIGAGPEGTRLAAAAGELPVTWRGWQPPAAVRAAMGAADLLLVTSEASPGRDFEGIPNVVVEAMALGLPVAAMVSGGIGELLDDTTGWPLPPAPDAAARVIAAAVRDPAALAARVAAARQRVVTEYDAAACFARKLAVWQGCAASTMH